MNQLAAWRSTPPIVEFFGVARSCAVYYGSPIKTIRMRKFYSQFVKRGDLVFDLGAHVGDRIGVLSSLGAQIIAVEPQPQMQRLLKLAYGLYSNVTLVDAGVGSTNGIAKLYVNRKNPKLTSFSKAWIANRRQYVNQWLDNDWDHEVEVSMCSVDRLIERFGKPQFCIIDVEGMELAVLEGLSEPLPQICFEHQPPATEVSLACIDRLAQLGHYEYNFVPARTMRLAFPRWRQAVKMKEFLIRQMATQHSGRIFARLL